MSSSARPLRVLYILHTAAAGGAAGSLRLLIEHLPPGTVEPLVLSPDGDAVVRFRKAGVAVRQIPGVSMFHSLAGEPLRGTRLLELLRTVAHMRHGHLIRAALREFRPDIVHLNERGMLHAARIASKAGLPVLMHARSVADRRGWWVRALGTALTKRYAARVVAIDNSVRWSLRELENCEVLYNPLPATAGQPVVPAGGARVQVGGPTRVVYLSGLLRFKGIFDLLAAARLLRSRRDILFEIAGANSRPPEFHRSAVGRLAHMAGFAPDVEAELARWILREEMSGTVRLLGHVEDTRSLFDRANILVFPSHLNGPGRSVFEAGAHGIPSIVTMVDRIEDIVEDGVTGLITRERDPRALADAILRLTDDRALRERLGENARRRYVEQFDGTRIGLRMLEIYRSCWKEPPR